MPGLTMAFRVGEKAAGVGFDWERPEDVIDKMAEELDEIREAVKNGKREEMADEIGDMLFATASLARKLDIAPGRALRGALGKFRRRFGELEERVKASGRRFDDYTLDELEAIWQSVK